MSSVSIITLLALSVLGGFVGALMSGASLLIFAGLTLAGVPIKTSIGTLKLPIAVQGLISSMAFARGGAVDGQSARKVLPSAVIGSIMGAFTTVSLPEPLVNGMVATLLIVGVMVSLRIQGIGAPSHVKKRNGHILGILAGMALGLYIGLIGIASAIVGIIVLTSVYRLSLLEAKGTGELLIFILNAVALLVFALHGSVDYILGLATILPVTVGSWLGAKSALMIGPSKLKLTFIAVTTITSGWLIYETLA